LRPWQPGQSGNPSGRPAVAKAVRERLRAYITDGGGFERLIALADGNTRDARAALELVFSYALGRPTQPLSGADQGEAYDPLEIIINRGVSPDRSVPDGSDD
jgi:hypothetical protein